MNNLYFKLARTNMKNNKPLYIPYILSGIMTTAMFYLMMFIGTNEGLNVIPGNQNLKVIIHLGVYVIGIFGYIFLFYTNSFIIKRRKKEVGVYNILGMEKRHISRILAFETLLVMFFSIAGGILFGILFSKLSLMILYRLLGFKQSISFFVSFAGIKMTVLVFGILYVILFFYNMMQIRLANPVELLRGSNVGEKEPKTKMIMTILGVLCIGVAYCISFTITNPLEVLQLFFIAVILVIVGTYFLFIAGSIALLKALRKNKGYYYNKKHFSAVSGMLYRMKQNAAGLASICVLSTMVVFMISTTVSMFVGMDDILKTRYPMEVSIQIYQFDEAGIDSETIKEMALEKISESGLEVKKEEGYEFFQALMNQTEEKFAACEKNTFDGSASMVTVISREDFLHSDIWKEEKEIPEIEAGSALVYATTQYDLDEITLFGQTLFVKEALQNEISKDAYMSSMLDGIYYVVVDSNETVRNLYADCRNQKYQYYLGFDLSGTKDEKIACGEKINQMAGNLDLPQGSCFVESRYANEAEFYSIYGGLFFLGLFLGTMFLTVTVMIIFYKQITEGYEDRDRYHIMEKVGMSSKEVKDSIRSQIRIVFFLPLVTAAIHVMAAFPITKRFLYLLNLSNDKLFMASLAVTLLIFTVIYYIVFKLTSRAYYKIVGK